jgi:hypothetical protein
MLLITPFVELRVVAGRNRTQAGRPHSVSGRPMLIHTCHAAPMPRCAVALRSRCQNGTVVTKHGRGMTCVNQTRPHCVNQMVKTQSKPLAARHGRGTAWTRHGMCEVAFSRLTPQSPSHTMDAQYFFFFDSSPWTILLPFVTASNPEQNQHQFTSLYTVIRHRAITVISNAIQGPDLYVFLYFIFQRRHVPFNTISRTTNPVPRAIQSDLKPGKNYLGRSNRSRLVGPRKCTGILNSMTSEVHLDQRCVTPFCTRADLTWREGNVIIVIIIIIINFNWVVSRWQWLFYILQFTIYSVTLRYNRTF